MDLKYSPEYKCVVDSLKKNCSKRTNCSGVRKTSARDNKQLRKIAVSNRFKSTSELTDLWNKQTVSRSTTYRRLRELGFKSRVPAVKPMLNKKQMEKRLKWAKEHGEWTAEDWQKVVFSDESRFCISFGDQGPRVWRRGGETYNHECVKRSVKFPQSVMVWGCMSARGVGELCFLKKTVNAAVYQDVLETFLIPTVEEQFGEEDFIFQQDLAPAHAAKSTKDWFTKKQLEVLAWPANSPDLNVIENLWAIVKRKIRDRKPTTLDQLKQNIATAWEAPKPNPETNLNPKPETNLNPKPNPETNLNPKPNPETNLNPKPNSKADLNPKPNPETNLNPKPNPKADLNPKPNPKADLNPKPNPKADLNPKPNPKANLNPKPNPKADLKPKPNPETNLNPKPNPETNLNPKPNPKADLNPKPNPKADLNPKPNPETNLNPKPNNLNPKT
ncbi:hypothetical protein NFI96_000130 [Prochilodus magdalenae]|nr:hypothetical protein NFI96_000130 [Prochilodus magdalenae]